MSARPGASDVGASDLDGRAPRWDPRSNDRFTFHEAYPVGSESYSVTSRRRYLSLLALGFAGCSTGSETPDDGPADGSPDGTGDGTSTPHTDPGTPTATPTAEVEPVEVDHPAVAWAARLPRPVSWAPAVHADSDRVFAALGRTAIGTPDGSDDPANGAVVALSDADGTEDWRAALEAPVAADLAVHGDRLAVVSGYSSGYDGINQRVTAFGVDGEERWSTDPRSAWLSVVAGHEGTTFAATGDDAVDASGERLFALGTDGSVEWEREVGDAWGATVADDALLYSSGDLELAAYDLAEGDERWSAAGEPLGNPDADVAVVDGRCFTQAPEEEADGYPLVARSVDDGSERWRYSFAQDDSNFVPTGVASLAAFDGAPALVGTEADGTVFALDADGGEAWRFDADGELAYGGPIVGDAVYAVTRNGRIVALDPENGEERWDTTYPGEVSVELADSGLFVYTGRNRGKLAAAVDAAGDERWRFELPSGVSDAAVAGDRLYAVVSGRSLYAFDLAAQG